MNNVTCIIPARGGSKGIPKKNTVDFCGKPLIEWTIEQACSCKYISDVFVPTDDDEISRISNNAGATSIITPKELNSDTAMTEGKLLYTLKFLERLESEFVVFLQCTSPLRYDSDLDLAIEKFRQEKYASMFSCSIHYDFMLWKRFKVFNENYLKPVTFDPWNRKRRQDMPKHYLENGSIYIFKPWVLTKYKNRFGGNIGAYEMHDWQSFQIDTPEDIEICTYFMKTKILDKAKTHGN